MINPYICKIDGDLSKADAVVLTLLSRNKRVIEFGVGASTLILSQVAKSLKCYDTDIKWINIVNSKLKDIDNKTCEPELILIEKNPQAVSPLVEDVDVLFNDGHSLLRGAFLLEFWPHIKECAVLHDSRMTYAGNCVKKFIDAFIVENKPNKYNPGLLDNPYTGSLKSIDWNWLESNMVVMHKRNCILKYENWKVIER